jgi:hypothetical protein
MKEIELFNLIKQTLVNDLEQTSEYSFQDAYSNALEMIFELKCRQTHYALLLIEKQKYDKLVQRNRVRYICSTPIGVYSFNLKKIPEPEWLKRWMPETTYFDRMNYVLKTVGYLNIKDSKNITKVLGISN